MKIFSYGSNMHFNRIFQRVPSVVHVYNGYVQGYMMKCLKRSYDGSGKGTIIPSEGEIVWGIVYDIDPNEKYLLDRAEGLGYGYHETMIDVHTHKGKVSCQVYIASEGYLEKNLPPYDWYKAFFVEGAKQHGLPEVYIAYLESIPSIPDPKSERRLLNENILKGS